MSIRNIRRKGRKYARLKESINSSELRTLHGKKMNQDIVLGTYSLEEWLIAELQRKRHSQGQSTAALEVKWLTHSGWTLQQFVARHFDQFTFADPQRAIATDGDNLVRMAVDRNKVACDFYGDPAWCDKITAKIDVELERARNLIQWVYSQHGDSIAVPLSYRPPLNSAYPWLSKPVDEYIDDYLDSDASVLILIGKPGTGKTSFIKNMIQRANADAKVAYDEKVFSSDSFFAGFIEDSSRFLVLEDADAFLSAREDGNTMMHRFLNVSDGLVSAHDKKLVFSTNLPSVQHIDAALMRPGRCFDVLEFRPLTRDEAHAVVQEAGHGNVPDGNQHTLAEIFSVQQNSEAILSKPNIGFV